MADIPHSHLMDSQPESNNFINDDFEQVDAAGVPHDSGMLEQDEEVTSTSIPGEEKAEEDRYAAGASEADPVTDPLDQLFSFQDDVSHQPSAPEPDSELLLNFSPPVPDPSSASPPSATTQEPTPPLTPEPLDFVKAEPKTVSETKEEPKSEVTWLKNIDPRVLDLIYWRDVRKTGVVFGSMMFILLSLAFFSVLSVVAYLSLAMLTVTLSFRVYKNVMTAVQKSNEGHPFKQYLEMDVDLPEDKVQKAVQNVLRHVSCTTKELRRLFLIEDLVDSIKFGLLLWVLTYIGSWFNGMTLIILGVVSVFTLPKVYETYKVQIDNNVAIAHSKLNMILTQVQEKLPFLKKKQKTQ